MVFLYNHIRKFRNGSSNGSVLFEKPGEDGFHFLLRWIDVENVRWLNWMQVIFALKPLFSTSGDVEHDEGIGSNMSGIQFINK